MLHSPASEAFIRQAMQEVCDVAAATGHALSPKLIDNMIAGTRAMPAYKTSMALDYENHRPMEIEAILGATVRAGKRAGVAMSALESIYALAKMIEAKRMAVSG
jgi:2-dehydropantoate 2-reductase